MGVVLLETTSVSVNTFTGGEDRGRCVQITTGMDSFVQMSELDAVKVALAILQKAALNEPAQ